MAENNNHNTEVELEMIECIENVFVAEEGVVILQSKVIGEPTPVCTWYKDGKPIETSQRTIITSGQNYYRLKIQSVTADDHGIYTILCKNIRKEVSSSAILFIAPTNVNEGALYREANGFRCKILQHLQSYRLAEGCDFELDVKFELDDSEDYECIWFKNNKRLVDDSRIVITVSDTSTSLRVCDSELFDTGLYAVLIKTKATTLSSFGSIQVTELLNELNESDSYLEQSLSDEVFSIECENVRLIFKSRPSQYTATTWHKDELPISSSSFVVEDYGENVTEEDAGKYSAKMNDSSETSTCQLSVHPSPETSTSKVAVTVVREMDSAEACCGAKVTFDCRFSLDDPTYYYVVWYIGIYKIKRSDSRFSVIFKGHESLLFIKLVELEMGGEVICELRKALPDGKSHYVTCSIGRLTIVPASELRREAYHNEGKIFNDGHPCGVRFDTIDESSLDELHADSENESLGHDTMEITYCRLSSDGLFFMNTAHVGYKFNGYAIYETTNEETEQMDVVVIIEWESWSPANWHEIKLQQDDGSFQEAGLTSVPEIKIENPPVGQLMTIRIKITPPVGDAASSVTISCR